MATWFNDYIPALVQTSHTGSSSEDRLLCIGFTMDPEGFSLKVEGVLVVKVSIRNNKWSS